MKKLTVIGIALVILAAASLPASSSLIDPDVVRGRRNFSVGFSMLQGFGLVTSGHFPMDNKMALGGSFGYSFENSNPYLFDLHMNLQFVEPTARSPIAMSLVGGLWGGTSNGLWLSKHEKDLYVLPELGVAMSYMFNSRLTGRMNLVFGPSLGVELGYKFHPAIEGIFAISEQVVGVKFKI